MASTGTIRLRLDENLLAINAALDAGDRRRFALLCKRRQDLHRKLRSEEVRT